MKPNSSIAGLAGTALLLTARAALAQPPLPPFAATSSEPTRGLEIPAGALVGDADATALELNPGQLGLVEHGTISLLNNSWSDRASRQGRGTGVFLALPLGALRLGGALQWLDPTGARADVTKTQVALALGVGTRFGLGAVWNHYFAQRRPGLHHLDAFDVGLSYRPFRHLGLGLAMRDANRPGLGPATALQRIYAGELAVRPLGDRRLEFGFGGAIGQDRATPNLQVRMLARVFRGVHLFGQVARVPIDLAGGAMTDARAVLGLTLDFENSSVAVAALASHHDAWKGTPVAGSDADSKRNSGGLSMHLRLSAEARVPLHAPARNDRFALREVKSDRDFLQLMLHLRRLARDPFLHGVLFEIDDLDLGLGRIEELHDAIAALRKAGKKTTAFFTDTGTRGYFLAAACDRVFMQRAGTLTLSGVATTAAFFKDSLDKLGIGVDLVRVAEYKGAMEPFVRSEFSEEVRGNLEELTGISFDRMLAAIAARRPKLHLDRLRALVDTGLFSAAEAKNVGLVDELKGRDELEELDGSPVADHEDGARQAGSWATPRVAVVSLDGPIVDGDSERLPLSIGETAGARSIIANLEKAASDGLVRAVILRVNSPGGSVTASEDIVRAIRKLRARGKPVLVSMGDVAASGGYYVAAPADLIFAQPLTTTGSIGIYTYHVDVANLAAALGVSFQTIKRGERADHAGSHRPWDDNDRAKIASHLRQLYQLFLDTVVEGRKARGLDSRDKVDRIGRGLVMKGERALREKLIDRQGGFLAALDEAVRRAGIPVGEHGTPEVTIYENVDEPLFKVAVTPARALGLLPAETGGADLATRLFHRLAGAAGASTLRFLAAILAQPDGALALPPFEL